MTSSTAAAARKQKHKSLSSDNVFSALEEIEFESFIEPLRNSLAIFRTANKEKKSSKINGSKTAQDLNGTATDVDADMEEDMNETNNEEITDGTEIED